MEPIVFIGGITVLIGGFWSIADFMRETGMEAMAIKLITICRREAKKRFYSVSDFSASEVVRSGIFRTEAPTSLGGRSVAARICTRR